VGSAVVSVPAAGLDAGCAMVWVCGEAGSGGVGLVVGWLWGGWRGECGLDSGWSRQAYDDIAGSVIILAGGALGVGDALWRAVGRWWWWCMRKSCGIDGTGVPHVMLGVSPYWAIISYLISIRHADKASRW